MADKKTPKETASMFDYAELVLTEAKITSDKSGYGFGDDGIEWIDESFTGDIYDSYKKCGHTIVK